MLGKRSKPVDKLAKCERLRIDWAFRLCETPPGLDNECEHIVELLAETLLLKEATLAPEMPCVITPLGVKPCRTTLTPPTFDKSWLSNWLSSFASWSSSVRFLPSKLVGSKTIVLMNKRWICVIIIQFHLYTFKCVDNTCCTNRSLV